MHKTHKPVVVLYATAAESTEDEEEFHRLKDQLTQSLFMQKRLLARSLKKEFDKKLIIQPGKVLNAFSRERPCDVGSTCIPPGKYSTN